MLASHRNIAGCSLITSRQHAARQAGTFHMPVSGSWAIAAEQSSSFPDEAGERESSDEQLVRMIQLPSLAMRPRSCPNIIA